MTRTPPRISVQAKPGRLVPIPPTVAAGPGGRLLLVGEKPIEVPDCSYVRRRLRADLQLAPAAAKATAPAPTKES